MTTTVRKWHKYRHTDYKNRTEGLGINPQVCGQLFHENQAKNVQRGKGSPLKKQWQENWPPYTKEHYWSSSISYRNLTKNPPFFTWSSFPPESSEMDLWSALRWTQETSTSSSFFPLAVPPCWWALRQPHYSQCGRSPVIQKAKPWGSWGDKAPASLSPSQVWRQNVLVPCGSEGGLAPLVGHQRRAASTMLTNPRGLIQNAALLCTLRLKAQTEMEPNISMTLLKTWLRSN